MNAVGHAKEAGNRDPDGAGSPTHPEIPRTFYGDGKTIRDLYNPGSEKKREGEIEMPPTRVDLDADWHEEGGDAVAGKKKTEYEIKLAYVHTRRPEGRLIRRWRNAQGCCGANGDG